MLIAKMNSMLVASAAGFSETFVKAGADVRAFAKTTDRAAAEAATSGGLKAFKAAFGEESGLGNFAKIATGAGAVAGLSLLGRAMEQTTAKALEMSDAFRSGNVSAMQMFDGIAGGLPILGEFWKAGANIREMFTGEQAAAMQAQRVEAKIVADKLKGAEAYKKYRDAIWETGFAIRALSLGGIDKTLFDIDQSAMKDIQRIREEFKGLSKDRIDALIGNRQKLQQAQREAALNALPSTDLGIGKMIAQYKQLADGAAAAAKSAQSEAAGFFEATRTPAEKLAAELEKINQLQSGGFLDADTAQRAREMARPSGRETFSDPGGPQLLQAGSQAAASFVNRMQRSEGTKDEGKQQVELAKRAEDARNKTNQHLAKLADNMAVVELI